MGETASFHRHYALGRALGTGGVGAVYEGRDLRTGRTVAIKRLQSNGVGDRRRIEREARTLAALESPYVARLYALEHDTGGDPFLVMEALQGETLAARGGRVTDDTGQVVTWAQQIALGLEAAHNVGILHRDIKPANVFLARTAHGTVAKVIDFGIAKDFAESAGDRTVSSGVLGTPRFMAPEQLRGHRALDARCDQYSLGLVLYWLLTKHLPFADTGDVTAYVWEVTTGRPTPIESHREDLPWELAQAIMMSLEPEPDRRFGSVRELADALAPLASLATSPSLAPVAPVPARAPMSPRSTRVAVAALVAVLSVAAALATLAASSQAPSTSTPSDTASVGVVSLGSTSSSATPPSTSVAPVLAPPNAAPVASARLDVSARPSGAPLPAASASEIAPVPSSHVREVSSARPLFL